MDPSLSHQCSRCLGVGHGALACSADKNANLAALPPKRRNKGKGKGKSSHLDSQSQTNSGSAQTK
eukprot:3117242-Amphidinium_carterae.1